MTSSLLLIEGFVYLSPLSKENKIQANEDENGRLVQTVRLCLNFNRAKAIQISLPKSVLTSLSENFDQTLIYTMQIIRSIER